MSEMAQQKAIEAPADELDDLVDELQPGTKLLKGQYTITRYLNSGGFGITYLAKDSLDRNVVIKECFPGSFCRRSKALVTARSRAHTAELRSVVQLFVREARNLAKIVHPNIVAVHQVFEDNGTAYMAIDYIDGLDLQQVIDGQGSHPSPADIVGMTEKLLTAVGFIHDHDMLHRDISPDNVLVDKKGEPVLIDFGAAREQASQKSRAMSALRVVKDGYSPQEFYIAGSEQGPWSDLYALGATLYHLISGEAPINGQARLAALAEDRADPFDPLSGRFEGYPPGFLEAIDRALNTLPKQRVQSAREWLMMFRRSTAASARDTVADAVHRTVLDFGLEAEAPAVALVEPVKTPAPAADFGAPPEFVRPVSPRTVSVPPQAAVAAAAADAPRGRNSMQVVAGVAVALTVVVAGLLLSRSGDEPAEVAIAGTTAATTEATTAAVVSPPVKTEPAVTETAVADTKPVVETPAPAAAAQEVVPAAAPATEVAAAEPPKVEAAQPDPVVAPVVAVAPEEPAVPTTKLGDAEVALLQDASRLSAAEAMIMENLLNTQELRLSFASPIGTLLNNQVTFAVWDIDMPFIDASRIVGGERLAIIARLKPTSNLEEAGDWIEPGLLLYAVNGVSIKNSGDMTGAVLNALRVDPDGKARVVVDYAGTSLQRQTGLLTVNAVRLVSLANGVSFAVSNIDGSWKTVVTRVDDASETNLRLGDVLFREKSSQTLLDGPETIEDVMELVVLEGAKVINFSVIRDNEVATAAMRLTVDPAK
jgi:hypothetical protein